VSPVSMRWAPAECCWVRTTVASIEAARSNAELSSAVAANATTIRSHTPSAASRR
jgi:hypothetical protein